MEKWDVSQWSAAVRVGGLREGVGVLGGLARTDRHSLCLAHRDGLGRRYWE